MVEELKQKVTEGIEAEKSRGQDLLKLMWYILDETEVVMG